MARAWADHRGGREVRLSASGSCGRLDVDWLLDVPDDALGAVVVHVEGEADASVSVVDGAVLHLLSIVGAAECAVRDAPTVA